MTRAALAACAAALLAAGAPAAAAAEEELASQVGDELQVAAGRPAPNEPRARYLGDTLTGSFDLGHDLSLDLSLGLLGQQAQEPVPRQAFGTRGGLVGDLQAGLAWQADEHWLLGGALDYSPPSVLESDTSVGLTTATGTTGTADALLSSRTSSGGVHLSAAWSSAGDSDLEWAWDLDAAATGYRSDQRIVALRTATGVPVTARELETYCRAHTCSPQLLGLLADRPASIGQAEIGAGVTATAWADTDLGLAGARYGYQGDPLAAGFFTLASAGRAATSFGTGMALEPLLWSVTPSVAHRFGPVSVRLWLQHGEYVDAQGRSDLLGVKVIWRATRRWRLWAGAIAQTDRDAQGAPSTFDQLAAGASCGF